MGNTLDSPKTDKDGESFVSTEGLECGCSGVQGWRIEMEDTHIATNIPSRPDHLFLGVWDGHAGGGAAKYAVEHMIEYLEQSEPWKEYMKKDTDDPELIGNALIVAFLEVDRTMKEFQQRTYGQDTSGCTSVTAIVSPKFIICANAGDSRCVMGTDGTAKALSDDHKPYNHTERIRVEAAGGFVQWNRVDGDLAVSRALGDFGYKNRSDLPPAEQKISPHPDISVHERTEKDDLLLLACDGLWDVMSTEEAVNQVREIFESGETAMLKVAEEMLDISLNKGSKDNVSVVVVKLPGATIGPASNGGVDGRRKLREDNIASVNNISPMPPGAVPPSATEQDDDDDAAAGNQVYFTPSPVADAGNTEEP